MKQFRHTWFRYGCALVMAGGLLAVGVGCGRAAPRESQQQTPAQDTAQAEPTSTPAETPAVSAALDALFPDHDLATLAWHQPDSASAAQWTDSVLASLSLDQKIGQLFIIHLPRPNRRRNSADAALEAVQTYGVGGFLTPRLLPPQTVLAETRRLQEAAAVPLFFAADYERGVGRFTNALTELPSNMALGATRDTLLAAAAGRLTALESRALGVNLLLAPVVDVNNNPDNPIINYRSYGEDPDLVGRMAAAFVREAQRHGVLATLKHFPGHGNTSVDSHTRMGVIDGDAEALSRVEFQPYRQVLGRGRAAAVMSAHLWVPAFDERPLPATFSRRLLRDVLRDSLGFDGFIVTDDIRMGALRNRYSADERIARALAAGTDVILTPGSLPDAVEAVKTALRRGDLDEAALTRSVRRILWAKAQAGLHRQPVAAEATLAYLLRKPRGTFLARTIAERAVTLLKADPVLPLGPAQRAALVQLSNVEDSPSIEAAMDSLAALLAPAGEARLGKEPARADTAEAFRVAAEADVVVLALFLRLQSGRGKAGLFPRQEQFVRRLVDQGKPVVLVTFGNPYIITALADAEVLLVAYEQSLASVAAVAAVLQGRQAARGTLPIAVDPYPFGFGLPGLDRE